MGSETELGKGICPADNRLPDAFSMPDEVEDALVCLAPRKVTLRGVAACKKNDCTAAGPECAQARNLVVAAGWEGAQ